MSGGRLLKVPTDAEEQRPRLGSPTEKSWERVKPRGVLSASAAGGGVGAGAPGPERSGAGEETHAAALPVLARTRHDPHPAEGSLLLH